MLGVKMTDVRTKAALTTSFVMSVASLYADAGNTPDANQDFSTTGANADKEWLARKFTPTLDGWVSTIAVTLGRTGSPAGTIYAEIYSDDGESASLPDAIVADEDSVNSEASDTVTITDLSAAAGGAAVVFRWTRGCPKLIAGRDYWLVLKSVGYTYTDGATELRWRTDANGAVGLNECAKYDANASPAWTTIGADVGADLTVSYAIAPALGEGNQVVILPDFTKGDSAGARLKIEGSYDNANWFQDPKDSYIGTVLLSEPQEREIRDGDQPPMIAFPVGVNYLRISSRAITDATNAELGLKVLVSSR